jgi:hypothetical protein
LQCKLTLSKPLSQKRGEGSQMDGWFMCSP